MRQHHGQAPPHVVRHAGAIAHGRAGHQAVGRLFQHGARRIDPFPRLQSAVEETVRAGVNEIGDGVENVSPLCLIKRRLVDAAKQAKENFILANGARAINACSAAFECHHLVHVVSVMHARCRLRDCETTLPRDDRVL